MKYVYGPVPSRRLGQSLGVDPIPFKTCNWNCIYCQLGRSTPMTNERRYYVSPGRIVDEIKTALEHHNPGEIDWITFVGAGEPTLNAGLGWMIQEVKRLSDIPIAVITNGALLHRHDVREELRAVDAVLPSLDAGSATLYRKINRPHPELHFDRVVKGLIDFRDRFSGKLWVEVMLIRALNDTEEALHELAAVLRRIRPDEVHVNHPVRGTAEPWVATPTDEGLMRADAILGDSARIVHPVVGQFDLSGHASVTDAVIEVITRHPMRQAELVSALQHWSSGQVTQALEDLAADGRARVLSRCGHRFWVIRKATYPEVGESTLGLDHHAHEVR